WLRDPNHEVLYLPKLPRIEKAGSPSEVKGQPKNRALTLSKPETESSQAASERPKPDFAGPQVIVSDLPDSTNNVQTIRRPDLVDPPKLSHPVRLQSMVMLPAHAPKVAVTPQIDQPTQPVVPNPQELPTFQAHVPHVQIPVSPMSAPKAAVIPQVDPTQPVVSNPQQLVTFRVSEPHVQVPVLPMGVPKQSSVVPAEAAVPKIANAADHGLQEFSTNAPSAPEAVVVINAVGVRSESSPAIPDAELSGSFVVGPSSGASAAHGGSAIAGGSVAGAGTAAAAGAGAGAGAGTGTGASPNAGGNASRASAGNASGTSGNGVGSNGGNKDGTARTGSLTITGGRPGGGGGAGTAAGSGSGSMPGISIAGGTASRAGAAVSTGAISRRPYAITVISGGSSGGATRDLGVFSRDETVYTVYIPMSDAGGGPDWPIEYALASSGPAGNGLLTPPVAVKKLQATGAKADISASSGPVFITGIIDDNGKLQGLRAIRALDVRAQSALKALAQWEFLPAQLDGKPVASRVLIGVSVMPSEEAAKR
ncbi:MAG: hypothetical protein JWN92_1767, partial [Candidatus Acidoferrum typicum]|nr:hypothetical protein [Candidatus Acidoferrum typicum]